LEAVIAVARCGKKELAAHVLPSLDSEDPVIRHTAYQALAKMEAAEALFTVIDDSQASPQKRQLALLALQRIHQPEEVDGLIERLKSATSPEARQGLLSALCRLYNIDGTWKGNSWGTRPDTRGPYYQPEKWEQSDKIGAVLKATLSSAASDESAFLLE